MPNRLLRDWTDSDKVNSLSVHAERFFTRLIMKVDDYGCFYADCRLLKANLFPLLLDAIREADMLRWMAECQKAGLIVLYESNNKEYLQINDFNQRLRQKTLKFPLPSHDGHMTDIRPPEVEEKLEVEVEEKGSDPQTNFESENFSSKNQKKEKYSSPGPEILFPIEHCLVVAMNDERWVKNNKASPESLTQFNSYLEGTGVYEKNPMDYKSHFHRWKNKQVNGTHQQPHSKPASGKSAGATELAEKLKSTLANFGRSGS